MPRDVPIKQLPVDEIVRLPKGAMLYCTVVNSIREGRRVCCARFRLAVVFRGQLWNVPVSRLEGFGIFDDGDKITLAADSIEILVSELGEELHGHPKWFRLRYP
jgi:hypothetical protein